MCGRYAFFRSVRALARDFGARPTSALFETYEPSYNLAPTRAAVGLTVTRAGERVLDAYRWGLVPHWASNPAIGSRLINARAETLGSSRAFSDSLVAHRLAVVADGFFEWRTGPDGRRRPLFFQRADGDPLLFAGLWASRPGLRSCTIITTAAGPDLEGIHDRMPAILDAGTLAAWLDPSGPRPRREDLLRPAPEGTLTHHPVDPRVGDVRNDGPDLIVPFDPHEPEPLRLFG